MGERQSAFHRDINWTGLCRTAALSFSHQQSKLRTFQIFVSLLNIFTGSFTATCLIFKCSLNKVIVFCFSFHCHAVRTLCCTLGWLFVMEITATCNNCLKSQNTHTHTEVHSWKTEHVCAFATHHAHVKNKVERIWTHEQIHCNYILRVSCQTCTQTVALHSCTQCSWQGLLFVLDIFMYLMKGWYERAMCWHHKSSNVERFLCSLSLSWLKGLLCSGLTC